MCSITAISRLPENIFTKTSSSWLAFLVKDRDLMGLKDVLHRFHAASPNMHWLVEEQIEEGDKVVSRFVWTGTLRAEFLGVPATVAECPFGG